MKRSYYSTKNPVYQFKLGYDNLVDFLDWIETEKGIDVPLLIKEYNSNRHGPSEDEKH